MEAKRRLESDESPVCGVIPERIRIYTDGADAHEGRRAAPRAENSMRMLDASANANVEDLAAPATSRTTER
jgi:hypothetical protein